MKRQAFSALFEVLLLVGQVAQGVVCRTRSGVPLAEPFLAWRDTVNVAALETVAFNVVQHQLGKRMYHCHILEHESQGMMGVLDVVG